MANGIRAGPSDKPAETQKSYIENTNATIRTPTKSNHKNNQTTNPVKRRKKTKRFTQIKNIEKQNIKKKYLT